MNTTIAKMTEEDDDRYKQINERIANMDKKIFAEATNPKEPMTTRIKAKLFHSETSESEVEQLLKETITEIRMSIETQGSSANYTCLHLLQE